MYRAAEVIQMISEGVSTIVGYVGGASGGGVGLTAASDAVIAGSWWTSTPVLYGFVPLVAALIGAVVGAIAAFLFNRWLNKRNQEHDRRIALFTFELKDLRRQLELLERAEWGVQRLLSVVRARINNRLQDEGEYVRAMAEAERIQVEFGKPFLTTTPAFDYAWANLAGLFNVLRSLAEESRTEVHADVDKAHHQFHTEFLRLNRLIFDGLKNFKEGRPVYADTPIEELYADTTKLQREFLRRHGVQRQDSVG